MFRVIQTFEVKQPEAYYGIISIYCWSGLWGGQWVEVLCGKGKGYLGEEVEGLFMGNWRLELEGGLIYGGI